MTIDDLNAMLVTQDGVCAICLTAPAVHVDHDHRTGAVRGLLCFRCNAALGQLDDDPLVLRRAARYLEDKGFDPPVRRDVDPVRRVHQRLPTRSLLEQRFRAVLAGTAS